MPAKIDKNTTSIGMMTAGFSQLLIGRKVRLQSTPRVHPAAFARKKMRNNARRGRSALLTPGPAETAERLPNRLRRPDRPGEETKRRSSFSRYQFPHGPPTVAVDQEDNHDPE